MPMCFTFKPVVVNRGRKFKGHAYFLGHTYESHPAWNVTAYSTKLWDPAAKAFVWANPDFCEDEELPEEKIEADRKAYVDSEIEYARNRFCKGVEGALLKGAIQHARNWMYKNFPQFEEAIDKAFPDQRDVAVEVERVFQWVGTLKSSPAVIYGKVCPGGKPYGNAKKVRIAFSTLVRKGMTVFPEFAEVFEFYAETMHMKMPKDVKSSIDYLKTPEGQAHPERVIV